MTNEEARLYGEAIAKNALRRLERREPVLKGMAARHSSDGAYSVEEVVKLAKNVHNGGGLPSDLYAEDVEEVLKSLGAKRRHASGFAITQEQAEADVLKEMPELYTAMDEARRAPYDIEVEEYELSAAEETLEKRVSALRRAASQLSEAEAVAELLAADPDLYDQLEPRGNQS